MADYKQSQRPPGQGPDLMTPEGQKEWLQSWPEGWGFGFPFPGSQATPAPSSPAPRPWKPMFPWHLGPGQTNPNEPWYPSLDPSRLIRPAEWIDPSAPKPGEDNNHDGLPDDWQQLDPVIPLPGPGYRPSRWGKPSGPILGPPGARSARPMFGGMGLANNNPRSTPPSL